jgi:hypothetical protein
VTIDGDEVLPLAGVSGRVTLLCNEGGQWVDYRSDRRGFNNPDRVWDPGPMDVVALGDSSTGVFLQSAERVRSVREHGQIADVREARRQPLQRRGRVDPDGAARAHQNRVVVLLRRQRPVDLQIERKSALLSRYLTAGFSQPRLADKPIDRGILAEIPREKTDRENDERRRRNATGTAWRALSMGRCERFGLIEGSADARGSPRFRHGEYVVFRKSCDRPGRESMVGRTACSSICQSGPF